jgi:hypothetical protein
MNFGKCAETILNGAYAQLGGGAKKRAAAGGVKRKRVSGRKMSIISRK